MKRTLKIVSLIALCFIVIGAALAAWGWKAGANLSFTYLPDEHKFITEKEEVSYKEETLAPFSNIHFDLDAMNILIKKGDDFTITYPNTIYNSIDFSVENDTLYVKNITTNTISFSFDMTETASQEITITVPENPEFDTTIIGKSDSGNVTISNLIFATIKQEVNAGNINLEKATGGTAILTSEIGNINLSSSRISDLQINSNYGNCEVSASTIERVLADMDTGDLTMSLTGRVEDYTISLDVETGTATINNFERDNHYIRDGAIPDNRIQIKINCGNVDIHMN